MEKCLVNLDKSPYIDINNFSERRNFMSGDKISEVLYKYKANNNDKLALITKASTGLNANSFFELAEISGINKESLAGFLNLSLKTFNRYYKENKKLNPVNSEQILKFFMLYNKGTEVFGTINAFNNWLHKPAFGLGNLTPYSFLSTISGIDLIYNELINIEFGDFS